MKDISKHNKETVKEECLVKALEFTQKGEMIPSLVIESDGKLGCLYLGGFKAVLNKEFVSGGNVKGVVNTVGQSLFAVFGKKFEGRYNDVVCSCELDLLEMQWEDNLKYDISDEDLALVIRHIHKVRCTGGSVIVHCAQGKSRSTTAVVAYLMALNNAPLATTLSMVKEKRKMAEPNPHFMYRLSQFENSELKTQLHTELVNS